MDELRRQDGRNSADRLDARRPHQQRSRIRKLDRDGQTTIPGGVCQGTVLGLAGNVRLVNTIGTGANGSGSVNGQAGTAACGGRLQLIETPSCNTTNVANVP